MGRSIVTAKSLAKQQAARVASSPPPSAARGAPGLEPAGSQPAAATAAVPAPTPAETLDDYGDRLLKLIPAEVVTLYMAMDGIINSDETVSLSMVWGIFVFCLFATWFHLKLYLKVKSLPQILISMMAFAIWALNIGSGFPAAVDPKLMAIVLLAFTFVAPKIPID